MALKNFEWRILVRVLLLLFTQTIASYILVRGMMGKNWFIYLTILLPVIAYQVIEFYRFQRKAHTELDQFVESVHYRDFSRYFDVKHAPSDLKPIRKGFNEINTTFKIIGSSQ